MIVFSNTLIMWYREELMVEKRGIVEIGDVTEEEALLYLERRGIDKKQAAQIYKFVGGRLIHLSFFVDDLRRTGSFEGMCTTCRNTICCSLLLDTRRTMFDDAKSELKSADIFPSYPRDKEGAKVIRQLLQKGSMSDVAFSKLVGADVGNRLLESNVFAYHLKSQEITFQSTVMKRFCEENQDLWKSFWWW